MSTVFEDSFSEEVWYTTYKDHNDNNIDETFRRVAKAVASVEETAELKKEWEEKFYDLLSDFKTTTGGRIYANAGTEFKGTTLMNCFVGPKPIYDQDSLKGIFDTLLAQAQTLKSEGGWGMNFSFIRPRRAFIHGIGVESPGAVKYMELFDKSSDIITAGSGFKSTNKKAKIKIRKGAMMGGLDCWHPDIEEFITAKLTEGRLSKFNISVNCSNEFMDKIVKLKELEAKGKRDSEEYENLDKWPLIFPETTFESYKAEWNGNIQEWINKGYPVKTYKTISTMGLWELIMKSTYTRNDPGVLFLDIANKTHAWSYDPRSYIQITNPCVLKGTLVNTPIGYVKVEDVKVGDKISTLHPLGYEAVNDIEVHENTPVFKIAFSDGGEQIVTAAHRYHVQRKNSNSKFIKKLRVDELQIGDLIQVEPLKNNLNKSIDYTSSNYKKGLATGILLGDGCYTDSKLKFQHAYISSNREDINYNIKVKELFNSLGYTFIKDEYSKIDKGMKLLFNTESVPKCITNLKLTSARAKDKVIPDYYFNNLERTVGIINGLLASDGNINLKSNHPQIRFDTTSKKMAQQIRLMLLTLGAHGRITKILPENINGGIIEGREIISRETKYTVNVGGSSFKNLAQFLYTNIHDGKLEKIKRGLYNSKLSDNTNCATILSIESYGEGTVYDLHCKESDTWITEGYVQQGCGEQCLPFGAVCNLGSINLVKFVTKIGFDLEKLGKYLEYMVRFLDNVNSYTKAPLVEYEESIKRRRRIGIGVMGWGSALYLLKVRFGSDKAYKIQQKLMKFFTHTVVKTSIDLAIEKGMFADCQPDKHAEAYFWKQIGLPEEEIERIANHGIRNSALFSIQPTGNTSILANIVSGGLEPVFMPEYIRTVIVSSVPEHIKDVCPKYWAGEFKETEMFKFAKEGGEEILKGKDETGTIYKIDKNRGLTKEVLCEDYAVRHLKKLGEWDSKADWAATTETLTVEEHIRDMEGFGKWVDSSMSKTVNVPHDYPYDKFQDLYLNAYKTGFLKGITTYRAGTMTTVLAAVEPKDEEGKVTITKTISPKRPKELPCDVYHSRVKNEEYYVIVGKLENDPYEVFTGRNEKEIIPKDIKEGKVVKKSKGQYFLVNDDLEVQLNDVEKHEDIDALTRLLSTSLRHGSDISFVVHQLEKTRGGMQSFGKVIARNLKRYIKDGTIVEGEFCPTCNSGLIRESGCIICKQCGFSKCG